ncbi:MAG: hypothetical protein ABI563_08210 [Specibacter sp.]
MEIAHDYVDRVQEQWQLVEPGINSAPAAIIHRMRQLAHLIARQSKDVLLASGLSRADFDILALLTRAGEPLCPTELAEDLITSGPGTTKHRHDTIIPALRNISAFDAELLSTLPATGSEQLAGLLRELLLLVEPPVGPQKLAAAARQPCSARMEQQVSLGLYPRHQKPAQGMPLSHRCLFVFLPGLLPDGPGSGGAVET